MSSEIALIFGSINMAKSIAEYFGLIDGVSSDVKKLLHQAFKSAKYNLECASTSYGQNQRNYIEQAKSEFIRAIVVEENENEISAYVGLSMCQYLLGDKCNAKITLSKAKDVTLSQSESDKYVAITIADSGCLGLGGRLVGKFMGDGIRERAKRFLNYKSLVLSLQIK